MGNASSGPSPSVYEAVGKPEVSEMQASARSDLVTPVSTQKRLQELWNQQDILRTPNVSGSGARSPVRTTIALLCSLGPRTQATTPPLLVKQPCHPRTSPGSTDPPKS